MGTLIGLFSLLIIGLLNFQKIKKLTFLKFKCKIKIIILKFLHKYSIDIGLVAGLRQDIKK